MDKPPGSKLRTSLWCGAVALLVAGGVFSALLTAKAGPTGPPPDPAMRICTATLEDVQRALYIYRAERTWDWTDLIEYNEHFSPDPAALAREFDTRRRTPEWLQFAAAEEERRAAGRFAPAPPEKDLIFGALRPFEQGASCIVVRRAGDDPDEITALITGIAPGGSTRQIEARLRYSEATYSPEGALHARAGAVIEGLARLEGGLGRAAVDGDLYLYGSPAFSHSAVASGSMRASGDIDIKSLQSGAGVYTVPEIIPAVYRPHADYVLDRHGRVVDAAGGAIADATGGRSWQGASWHPQRGWRIEDGPPLPSGVYFVEGTLQIFSLGLRGEEIATFIAEGSVILEGNLRLRPKLPGTLVIAGGDLLVNGASGMRLAGVLATREQARIGGNPIIDGAVIVSNAQELHTEIMRERVGASSVGAWLGGSVVLRCEDAMQTSIKAPLHAIRIESCRTVR